MRLAEGSLFSAAPEQAWTAFIARWRMASLPVVPGAILVLAAALRVWHLGAKPLWFDETWSVFIARQPLEEIPRLLRLYDHLPPLYYLLLNIWIALFGTAEASVRLPSVLAGVGAVGATFFLAERVAGRRVALLGAALLAISPFQIAAAQEARTYSFITLFALGAAYGLWRAVEEGQRHHWLLYAGCLLLALYTHHFSF
ncbi:MAG: glycosyltransferase family 39 protein, partial [Anaerolineales bacterium]